MDRLRALRTFIAVADNASFAEAGRRLGLSATTVTRMIAELEEDAGTPLLVRTTRTVRMTEDGAIFLRRCRTAIAELDEAFATVRGGSRDPHGTLTVTAPVMFGRLHILPIVVELLGLHPRLHVRLLLVDRVTNMAEEAIDVAVRIGNPADSALHMVKVGEINRVFCASPGYIGTHGQPAHFADLGSHAMIDIADERGISGEWQVPRSLAQHRAATRLTVNSVEAGIAAAAAGLGIVRALSYQVADRIADGTLAPIMTAEPAQAMPVSLMFQSERRDTPNIRAFLTLARERLAL